MHSQNSEEKFILEYFGDFVGTFLDLGSNDGITFSNTRALALRKWRGIFVDASPKAMERCKTLYNGHKGYYFYTVAIAEHNGKGVLQESGPLCSPTDMGLVSSMSLDEVKRWSTHNVPGQGRGVKFDPIEVKTFRWKTFYNRLKIKKFDFVSIDCESQDLQILSQMDLTDVKCICLEWNGKQDLKLEFEKYLNGFRVIYTSGENLLFAR